MRLRTSCFNVSIFKKNVILYWPVWTIYTACLLFLVAGSLWKEIHFAMRGGSLNEDGFLQVMYNFLSPAEGIFLILIMAVITAMALFSYLFTAKSCNMIHAFPVTRQQLFVTNVCTGFVFLLVPLVLNFLVCMFLCLGYGVTCVEYIGIWLLVMAECATISFSVAVFCAMLTGQLFALPIYYIAVNLVGPEIILLIGYTLNFLGFGLSISGNLTDVAWLSPEYYMMQKVYVKGRMEFIGKKYICTKLEFFGAKALALYLPAALLLFFAAYVIYKRRPLEQAGNLVTVRWLKPVFRWVVGIFGGYTGAYVLTAVLSGVLAGFNRNWLLAFAVLAGAVAFFAAQMLIEKKFRVFVKRMWAECACLCGVMLMLYGALFVTKRQMENYIPAADAIETASVSLSYRSDFSGEDIKAVLALHKAILAKKDMFDGVDIWNRECAIINITYTLNDGREISRHYTLPADEGDGREILFAWFGQESEPERFIGCYLEQENPNAANITEGELELYDKNYNYLRNVRFTEEQIEMIFAAAKADAVQGKLQKYNLANRWISEGKPQNFCCSIHLHEPYVERQAYEFITNGGDFLASNSVYYSEAAEQCHVYLSFGADCTNLIDALLDIGAITSAEELELYEGEEEVLTEDVAI